MSKKTKQVNKQLDKEVLRRYFLVSYEIAVTNYKFFIWRYRGQLSVTTNNGKYINKVLLMTKLPPMYPKKKIWDITFLHIDEIRRADYEEYGTLFNPDGTPVKLTKPVPLHKNHRNR